MTRCPTTVPLGESSVCTGSPTNSISKPATSVSVSAIVNYGVMAIIQDRKGYADAIDMSTEEATKLYDEVIHEAKELMLRKNHDYGEAWREMSKEGIVDMILAKIIRIKTILSNGGKTIASEGVEGNYFDIINYAIFDLIHYEM